jgi:glycine/sarcosine N-methyltransferase
MAPTTDIGIRQFYDHLAGDYDRMTGLEKRFAAERPAFAALVDTYGIRSAVDAGAGTGFHTLLLSELGVSVTAVDLSSAMLEALRANARERHVEARTIQSSFEDLPSRLTGTYDAVFCMGNSLPHLLTEGELTASLKSFRAILKAGGMLLVQMLNYTRILAERERILSAKEEGDKIFVRFYDFLEARIGFNLLTITRSPSGLEAECTAVPLRPWQGEELERLFAEAGFSAIRFFGNVAMNQYDPVTSRDLVMLAQH